MICCSHESDRLQTINHSSDIIISAMASQITSLTTVYPTVYSADQWKHQSSVLLAFVRGIHMTGEFPAQRACSAENADDVIMTEQVVTRQDFRTNLDLICTYVVGNKYRDLRKP